MFILWRHNDKTFTTESRLLRKRRTFLEWDIIRNKNLHFTWMAGASISMNELFSISFSQIKSFDRWNGERENEMNFRLNAIDVWLASPAIKIELPFSCVFFSRCTSNSFVYRLKSSIRRSFIIRSTLEKKSARVPTSMGPVQIINKTKMSKIKGKKNESAKNKEINICAHRRGEGARVFESIRI